MTNDERMAAILLHVNRVYSKHGGSGYPPSPKDVLAIIRSILEFAEINEEKGNGIDT